MSRPRKKGQEQEATGEEDKQEEDFLIDLEDFYDLLME